MSLSVGVTKALTSCSLLSAWKSACYSSKAAKLSGIMEPRRVSAEVKSFLGGVSVIPKALLLQEIWAYIRHRNLTDPTNKKIIICDEKLKSIFGGKDRVQFREIDRLLEPHIR